MSLSFVSKTIQTSRDDGGFDEKPSETAEQNQSTSSSTGQYKPLFEQLRDNKEQEEAEQAEIQRARMRGTLALDEEACAHLDAVQKQRQQEEADKRRQTELQLAAFRAARAERRETLNSVIDEKLPEIDPRAESKNVVKAEIPRKRGVTALPPPKVIVKKKRRNGDDAADDSTKKTESRPTDSDSGSMTKKEAATGGIGSLLSCYGSSDDEEG